MKILAIETSCDETALALVEDGSKVLCSILATSADLHEKTGGVVPEVAARKQVEYMLPLLQEMFESNSVTPADVDAIAVTVGPGLIGSLLIGVETARTLSIAWNKPLVPVNHLVGHIYANFINRKPEEIVFPALVLIVSGGHTDLVLMNSHDSLEYLGGTLDDAVGEAFDKTARMLNIKKYLGGALLSELGKDVTNNPLKDKLPRPKIHDLDYDFSFSGLKTAVRRLNHALKETTDSTSISIDEDTKYIAREFEDASIEVLVSKLVRAAKEKNVSCVLVGGGVAANSHLRNELEKSLEELNLPLFIPPIELCGDNAIYIGSAAFYNYKEVPLSEVEADPSLNITD